VEIRKGAKNAKIKRTNHVSAVKVCNINIKLTKLGPKKRKLKPVCSGDMGKG
jgi:hypothetical protein